MGERARDELPVALRTSHLLAFPLAAACAVALAFVLRPPGGVKSVADVARVEPARWDGAEVARLAEAGQRYEAGDWTGAATALSEALAAGTSGPDSLDARFWLGMCLLLQDRPAAALPHLEAAASAPGPAAARADWYRAQALLRLEDVDAARAILDELSRESPAYARSAAEQLLALRGR